MAREPENPKAAGAPMALAIVAGALVGAAYGQSTIGVLIGFACGAAIAIAMWLWDRGRG